jgi:hypothetical protein
MLDINAVAEKIIVLKVHYPTANLTRVLMANPKVLLQSKEELGSNAAQVGAGGAGGLAALAARGAGGAWGWRRVGRSVPPVPRARCPKPAAAPPACGAAACPCLRPPAPLHPPTHPPPKPPPPPRR